MDRRGFLRFLGMGVAAAVAPTKAYSFLGGILRPRSAIITPENHGYSNDDEFAVTVGNYGGMVEQEMKNYRIEFHGGRLWIISTHMENTFGAVEFS